MAETLYLRLDYPAPGEAVWRTSSGIAGQGAIAEAAALGPGRRVVVLVESAAVLLLEATLPTRKRDRLLQAVPYALEEHLAAEVESLHFALGTPLPSVADKSLYQIPVAVVARSQMDSWLETLKVAGINPHALVPDVLALPIAPGSWTLLVEDNSALLRTGTQSGYSLALEWIPLAIEQAGAAPPLLRVAVPDGITLNLPPLAVPIAELPCPESGLALLVDGYRPNTTLDLMQGAYSPREQLDRIWRPWRAAAALLLILLGLHMGELFLEAQQLSAEDLSLRTRMADIYQNTFPDAKRIVNPYVQMEQRLTALRTQPEAANSGLIGLLARAAPILQNTSGSEVRALRYRNSSLEFDLSLRGLPLLDQLKKNFTDTGLEVEVRTARVQGDAVDSSLVVRDGGK